MANNNFGQTEQDRALRLIEVQMKKGATMLDSIQSGLKKASLLAKGQATEQFEYGAAGQLIGSMIEGDLDRWRRQAGLVDESDEQRERQLRNAEGIVNTWIEVTAHALESIGPELAERFVPLGGFVERPRSARERVVNLEKHLAEHVRRLCSIYEQVRLVGVPAKAAQSSPTNEEPTKGQPGRPGLELDHDELIYRLAMAQWAEQMKRDDPDMRWNEIQVEIGWDRGGSRESKAKLLYYARDKLHRFERKDPDNLLEEVAQRRRDLQPQAELKKETKET